MGSYEAVRVCAIALLAGAILQAEGVSAGRGIVVDWRTIRSGETLVQGADAFDAAQLFVSLVGEDVAVSSVKSDVSDVPVFEAPAPRVNEFMKNESGARRRSFDAGPFHVIVEPHNDDDAAQAAFTQRLARLAVPQ